MIGTVLPPTNTMLYLFSYTEHGSPAYFLVDMATGSPVRVYGPHTREKITTDATDLGWYVERPTHKIIQAVQKRLLGSIDGVDPATWKIV